MKIALLILLLFGPLFVRADEPRYRRSFTSPNDKFEFQITPNTPFDTKWTLIEKNTKKTLYEIEGQFASFTVLVSDDGKNLVAIDDYSERDPETNPEVLQFFGDGKRLKGYKLSELLENTKIHTRSVSHFYFLLNRKEFDISDSRLKLSTFELFNYEFDVKTGGLIKKERDPRLTDGAIFAYGDISGSMSGDHQMKVSCVIYGKMPADGIIKFKSKRYIYDVRSAYDAVIIKNGELIEHLGLHLNVCRE